MLRIFPERIAQWRVFSNGQAPRRLLVNGRRADEDILAHATAENRHAQFEVGRLEPQPIQHHFRISLAERLSQSWQIPPLADDGAVTSRHRPAAAAQNPNLVPLLMQTGGAGAGNIAGAAQEQDSHLRSLRPSPPRL